MIFDVVVPIDGFEDEKKFSFKKVDDFFSIIIGQETKKEIRLMSFGALKSISFNLPDDFKSKLQIEDNKDISIFYIFILQSQSNENELNTFAPIILNHKTLKMGQIHLNLEELGLENLSNFLI